MDKLILFNDNENGHMLDARTLHEFLGAATRYSDWFPRMCEYGFIEGTDYKFKNESNNDSLPFSKIDHLITIEMAKEISMLQRTDRGKLVRQYFIEVEKLWNDPEALAKKLAKWTSLEAIPAVNGINKPQERINKALRFLEALHPDIKDFSKIEKPLLFEISKQSAPKELRERVLSGDIKTLKELKELKKKYYEIKKENEQLVPEIENLERKNKTLKQEKSYMEKQINNLSEISAKKDLLFEHSQTRICAEFKALFIDINAFISSKIPIAKHYLSQLDADSANQELQKVKADTNKILNMLEE